MPVCIGNYLEVQILQKIYKMDSVGAGGRELTSDALSTFLNSKRVFLFWGSSTWTGNMSLSFTAETLATQNRDLWVLVRFVLKDSHLPCHVLTLAEANNYPCRHRMV